MVHYTDEEYIDTELILAGKKEMNPKLQVLAKWISDEFDIEVIHLIVDYLKHLKRERLQIITKSSQESNCFKDNKKELGNFDPVKQELVAKKYLEIVKGKSIGKTSLLSILKKDAYPNSKELFVCSSAFNPIAREATISKLDKKELDSFKKDINIPELWEIQTSYGGLHIFLFTDEQIENFKDTELFNQVKSKFFEVVKKHDKYNLFDSNSFGIYIDSKENFDNNYESSWFYYYK
jgi:hypothetical protein